MKEVCSEKYIIVSDIINMCIQTKTRGKGSNKVHKPIIINTINITTLRKNEISSVKIAEQSLYVLYSFYTVETRYMF